MAPRQPSRLQSRQRLLTPMPNANKHPPSSSEGGCSREYRAWPCQISFVEEKPPASSIRRGRRFMGEPLHQFRTRCKHCAGRRRDHSSDGRFRAPRRWRVGTRSRRSIGWPGGLVKRRCHLRDAILDFAPGRVDHEMVATPGLGALRRNPRPRRQSHSRNVHHPRFDAALVFPWVRTNNFNLECRRAGALRHRAPRVRARSRRH